jgi:serine/threonine protein kinase
LDKNKRVSASDAMLKRTSQQKKNGIHIEDFIIVAKIGGGKYGTVYKAFHIRTRTVYALKKISKQILKDQMMVTQFILEVKLQSYLKH